jgi:DNA-3-methyladenine glycosylase II
MYSRAKLHFKKADSVLYRAARLHKIADIRRSNDVFGDLVHAIVNQQLSGKAAETIYIRLETLVGGKGKGKRGKGWGKRTQSVIVPQVILKLSIPALRECGLSEAKAMSIKSLAKSVVRKEIDLFEIHKHDDDKVIELLTSIKGIGPWTAEMILMFSLGRQDIFSKGDLGLRKGIMHLYKLKKLPSDRLMDRLAKRWSPYRTYAARVLWRVADRKKVT